MSNTGTPILDIKISTSYHSGRREMKNIRINFGVMDIDLSLNEEEMYSLIRALTSNNSNHPVLVKRFYIPPLPIKNQKHYFEFNNDTLKPRKFFNTD